MTRTIKLLLLALALALGIVSSIVVYTLRQGREEAFIATDITAMQLTAANPPVTWWTIRPAFWFSIAMGVPAFMSGPTAAPWMPWSTTLSFC
jgi:hypothetical protein